MKVVFDPYIYELIYKSIDPWVWQMPHLTKDEIFIGMQYDIEHHIAFPFEYNKTMFYIKPENKWLYRIHMYSDTKSLKTTIQNTNIITNHLFDTCPDLYKLYGINPFKAYSRVISKAGWNLEGILSKSMMTNEQLLIDQYIYGITREQNTKFRQVDI